jgi:hypothetical protein
VIDPTIQDLIDKLANFQGETMHAIQSMKIKADKNEVLAALKTNRTSHKKIVEEAKEGYSQKAADLLKKKLDEVMAANGKFAGQLSFSIPLPQDHTKAYDVAIKMLELSQEPQIELTAQQVQHFVLDDWEWKDVFMTSSKMYSATANLLDP